MGDLDALIGAPLFGLLVHDLGNAGHRQADLFVLVDELGQRDERRHDAPAEHQECEQRADIDRIVGGDRKVDAECQRAADSQDLQRMHDRLDRVGDLAFLEMRLGGAERPGCPRCGLTRGDRERLRGADAVDVLDQERVAFCIGLFGGDRFPAVGREHQQQPHRDERADPPTPCRS